MWFSPVCVCNVGGFMLKKGTSPNPLRTKSYHCEQYKNCLTENINAHTDTTQAHVRIHRPVSLIVVLILIRADQLVGAGIISQQA